jgi:hypothetical protein
MLTVRSYLPTNRRMFGIVFAVLATAALSEASAQTAAPTASSAPAAVRAVAGVPAKKPGAVARGSLDLHTPPLNHIYPSSELRYILATDDSGTDTATEVSVKSAKYGVRVPGTPGNQLQAVPWAIVHPTQAWRIFTPLEEP